MSRDQFNWNFARCHYQQLRNATQLFFVSELRWFHNFVWIFHEVAFAMALFITILFWLILAPTYSIEYLSDPIRSINTHLINMIIMLVDLFLCDIPFRLLHFYHASIFGAVYGLFSLILHWAGYNSAIYPVLNWATGTGFAIGVVFGAVFVVAPLTHCIGFGLYHLRRFIAKKCLTNPTLNEPEITENVTTRFIADDVHNDEWFYKTNINNSNIQDWKLD